MRSAIIVGSEGQDGRLLFDRLTRDGYSVLGVGRSGTRGMEFGSRHVSILDTEGISEIVASIRPEWVFYLAAAHHAADSAEPNGGLAGFDVANDTHARGLVNFLEAIRNCSRETRLFYAASSRVFGQPASSTQDESTPLNPVCVYGITKATGVHLCRYYRDKYGLFVSSGFLYNHESPLRAPGYLIPKILAAARLIRSGHQEKLLIGSLDKSVDWGYAPDFIDAMVRILSLDIATELVVATGVAHTVMDVVEGIFRLADLDWRCHVEVDPSLLKVQHLRLVGDPAKLVGLTGWKCSVTFAEMLEILWRSGGRGS